MRETKIWFAVVMILAISLCLALSAQASLSFPRENLTYAFTVVEVRNGTFTPERVSVYKNATVVWVNRDAADHALNVDDHVSPLLLPGESYTVNFRGTGRHEYHCRFHYGERGMIIVK